MEVPVEVTGRPSRGDGLVPEIWDLVGVVTGASSNLELPTATLRFLKDIGEEDTV